MDDYRQLLTRDFQVKYYIGATLDEKINRQRKKKWCKWLKILLMKDDFMLKTTFLLMHLLSTVKDMIIWTSACIIYTNQIAISWHQSVRIRCENSLKIVSLWSLISWPGNTIFAPIMWIFSLPVGDRKNFLGLPGWLIKWRIYKNRKFLVS